MSGRKVGRPKKTLQEIIDNSYLDDPSKWKEEIIKLYKCGGCDVEVRALLGGLSNDMFYKMVGENEEFKETIKKGQTLSEAWWREQGRTGLAAGRVNTGMYALQMRNRFGWFDANKQGETVENIDRKLSDLTRAIKESDTNSS